MNKKQQFKTRETLQRVGSQGVRTMTCLNVLNFNTIENVRLFLRCESSKNIFNLIYNVCIEPFLIDLSSDSISEQILCCNSSWAVAL